MFLHPISITSVVSGTGYTYCNEIDLRRKYYDDKNLSLFCHITSNGASGQLNVVPVVGNTSGTTFSSFITAGGTSTIILSGTSATGPNSNGTYIIPLTIVPYSGLTISLKGVPVIKFGFNCIQADCDVSAFLAVG